MAEESNTTNIDSMEKVICQNKPDDITNVKGDNNSVAEIPTVNEKALTETMYSTTSQPNGDKNTEKNTDKTNVRNEIVEQPQQDSNDVEPSTTTTHCMKSGNDAGKNEMHKKKDDASIRMPCTVKNPYKKATAGSKESTVPHEHVNNCAESESVGKGNLQTEMCTPAKRSATTFDMSNSAPKKKSANRRSQYPSEMLVEGYAFEDDIIAVAHRRNDGEEAFNLVLRNMVFNKELEDDGFSTYVALRDKSSGKDDRVLENEAGYPRFVFLSINVHHFTTAKEAHPGVLEQCRKLRAVASSTTHNIFSFKYQDVTDASDKTGSKLLVVSDVIRYADAFRILKLLYGDNTYRRNLEPEFGKKYPHIVAKYFSNVDDIPNYIKTELGL